MIFFWSFVIGGAICVIGQIMLDVFKLSPAHTLTTLVTSGALLGALRWYEPLTQFAGAGASVPITSFGNYLVKGALQEVDDHGLFVVFICFFVLTSAGSSLAHILGVIGA